MHQIVKNMYSWRRVAERTERVYKFVMDQPVHNALDMLKSNMCWGQIAGFHSLLYQVLEFLIIAFTEWWVPETEIDIARNFNA